MRISKDIHYTCYHGCLISHEFSCSVADRIISNQHCWLWLLRLPLLSVKYLIIHLIFDATWMSHLKHLLLITTLVWECLYFVDQKNGICDTFILNTSKYSTIYLILSCYQRSIGNYQQLTGVYSRKMMHSSLDYSFFSLNFTVSRIKQRTLLESRVKPLTAYNPPQPYFLRKDDFPS